VLATRPNPAVQPTAREWAVHSSVSTSLAIAASDVSVSYSRIQPAIGIGGHSWAIEWKRRFR
jgi:hypothetical protein